MSMSGSLAPMRLAQLGVPQSLIRTLTALGEFRGKQALWNQTKPEVLTALRQVALIESAESSSRMEAVEVGPQTARRQSHDPLPFMQYLLNVVMLTAYRELERNTASGLEHGARTRMVEQAVMAMPAEFRFSDVAKRCPLMNQGTIRSILSRLGREGRIVAISHGRSASWRRLR